MTAPAGRRARGKFIAVALVLTALAAGAWQTRQHWLQAGAESLVCESTEAPSDAILIDFVVRDYRLFERARKLQEGSSAAPILIPMLHAEPDDTPAALSLGIVDLMCRTANLADCTPFEVPLAEPISLNVARRAATEVKVRGARSVLLVTSGLRSRRAALVYSEVLSPLGIAVHCQPVFGVYTPANWTSTTHGIQEVGLQFLKLWYYRALVLS